MRHVAGRFSPEKFDATDPSSQRKAGIQCLWRLQVAGSQLSLGWRRFDLPARPKEARRTAMGVRLN